MHSNVAGGTELQRRTSEQTVTYFSPTIKDTMDVRRLLEKEHWYENAHYCDDFASYKQVLVQLNVRKEINLVSQYF